MKIEGERILLRTPEMGDVSDLVEGLNNLEVAKWLAGAPYPYTEQDAKTFIENAQNADSSKKIPLVIVLKEENKVIGGIEIREINKKDGTCGGGIWVNEKYQKNGYGTEAFSIRNKYCFEELGMRRIENGFFAGNEKSRKMQLKLGYKEEGIRRKKYLCLATNEYMDECVTGLLKEEFIEYKRGE